MGRPVGEMEPGHRRGITPDRARLFTKCMAVCPEGHFYRITGVRHPYPDNPMVYAYTMEYGDIRPPEIILGHNAECPCGKIGLQSLRYH